MGIVVDNFLGIEITDIASDFLPYDFDSFFVQGFRVQELCMLAQSKKMKDIGLLVRAVANVTSIDPNVLTIPDFYNLLYWLRTESYTKTPLYMNWDCNNVVDGKRCNFNNLQPVTRTTIKIQHLKDINYVLPTDLDYPRASLLKSLDSKPDDDPLMPIYSVAKWIKAGNTIDEKMSILLAQKDLVLYENALEADNTVKYGVHESVLVKCKGCGCDRTYPLSISADTFFQ